MENAYKTDKRINGLFLLIAAALGVAARWVMFDIQSGDYMSFLANWMEECTKAGGWSYIAIDPLRSELSTFNYSVGYQYVICLLAMLRGTLPDLYLIKIVSVIFDVLCAAAAYGIVRLVTENDKRKACVAFAVVLAMPTTVMNSAAWAQADSIYSFFLLMSLYFLLKERPLWTWVFFGLALAFKLQAILFLPFLIIAWLLKKTELLYIFVAAVVYVLSMVPAYLIGRPVYSLIEVYTAQVELYTQLSMNYPNIYTVIPDNIDVYIQQMLIPAGVILTVFLFVILAYICYTKRFAVTKLSLLTLAVFTFELAVFCLPVMHERYAYAASVMAFLYGLTGRRRFAAAVFIEALTIATYARFLFSSTVIKLYPLAAVLLLIILFIAADLWTQMQIPETEEEDVDGTEHGYISEAAAHGVPRVSDVSQALSEGKDLQLKPQEGDAPEDVLTFPEETVPTLDAIVPQQEEAQAVSAAPGTDRDRTQPEQTTQAFHAPTLEELFGAEYATDKDAN